mmetsp:Transcript_17532/g.24333  ORF Transcript_17532/g.24333 Transcript_17532/m.24333 type:complete len:163 (+) Transcript_17532:1077-1565(+)
MTTKKAFIGQLTNRVQSEPHSNTTPPAVLLATSPPINLREEGYNISLASENETSGKGSTGTRAGKRKMWYLGIVSSRLPHEIMQEVFRALKATGFEWKILGPYQLRCRKLVSEGKGESKFVKIGLQLYKVKETKYLLDIKKLEGETFPFFDWCSKLLNELNL